MSKTAIDQVDQGRALARAFLTRFFESEITSGTDDLKGSFFWLLAALAMPGLFIPWLMVFDWQGIILVHGPEALREASQAEKVFYLGFSMIASGLLTAVVWSSVLPDRRDTLILGALPVQPRTVVAAKLAALASYIAIVAVSMHALAALSFGALLSDRSPFLFLVRGVFAHFAASCAATAAVALSVAAAQGLALAVAGPRLFKRLTIVLQIAVVGLIALGVGLLPAITSSTVHTVRGFGKSMLPWVLSTPPVWFLGLYEWILGTSDPVVAGLAQKGVITLAVASVLVVLTYPIAYYRLMVSVVETGAEARRNPIARLFPAFLVFAAGRHAEARATADFFTATLARVERHRFVLAVVIGIALVWSIPGWKAYRPDAGPQAGLLSIPLVSMMFLAVGLRVASSLPSDVRASWLFEVHAPSRRRARQGLERMMFLLGVLPPVALSTPVFWWLWNREVALAHAVISLALGIALIELLVWRCEGMPCGQQWNPARLDLGRRWPLHAALFLIVAALIPRLELLLFRRVYATFGCVIVLLATAVSLRYASARHQIVPSYDDVDPVAGVLRLN